MRRQSKILQFTVYQYENIHHDVTYPHYTDLREKQRLYHKIFQFDNFCWTISSLYNSSNNNNSSSNNNNNKKKEERVLVSCFFVFLHVFIKSRRRISHRKSSKLTVLFVNRKSSSALRLQKSEKFSFREE